MKPSEAGIADRAVCYDERYIKTGYEPPQDIVEALAQVFPMVQLDWHPVLQRWTLWERHGRQLSLIAALVDE